MSDKIFVNGETFKQKFALKLLQFYVFFACVVLSNVFYTKNVSDEQTIDVPFKTIDVMQKFTKISLYFIIYNLVMIDIKEGDVPPPCKIKSTRRESRHLLVLKFWYLRIDKKSLPKAQLFHSKFYFLNKNPNHANTLFTFQPLTYHGFDKYNRPNSI